MMRGTSPSTETVPARPKRKPSPYPSVSLRPRRIAESKRPTRLRPGPSDQPVVSEANTGLVSNEGFAHPGQVAARHIEPGRSLDDRFGPDEPVEFFAGSQLGGIF